MIDTGSAPGNSAAMTEPALPVPPLSFDEPAAIVARRRPLGVTPRHVRLEVRLDPTRPVVEGRVSHVVRGLHPRTERVTLDAADLVVSAAWQDGKPIGFAQHVEGVDLHLGHPVATGEETTLTLEYRAHPTVGLFFVGPTADAPDRRPQIWTQGAMEDHHHWFPCFDAPEHLVTTEVIATVPEGYLAVSNGAPVPAETATAAPPAGWRRFHWRLDTPHALYLLTLVVDALVEVEGRAGEVTLHHYVPAGREVDAAQLFARMPEMLAFYGRSTGRPYPFGRYGHVFLQEFMWGGMENTTLTSLTDLVLVEGRHRDEEDVERLFAHELAHQWFGDLIAPRGWPEIWLNESFATYWEVQCMGALDGPDAFERRLQVLRDNYLGEAHSRYARAVVTRRYAHPYVLFDKHAYEKGALVLHTLRDQLGDALFFAGVQRYVRRCAGQAAETAELRRCFEEVSGADLTDFFEELVYGAGHPRVTVSWRFDPETGLQVGVKRTDTTAATVVVTLEIGPVGGPPQRRRLTVGPGERTCVFELSAAPRWVALDPDAGVLLEVDETAESDAALRARLWPAPTSVALRTRTCRLLAERATPANRAALAETLGHDPSEAVRIEAAKALGEHRHGDARNTLLDALEREDAWRVRAAAARAVGIGADDTLVATLEPRIGDERSHRVRCGYLRALGDINTETSRSVIRRYLDTPSPRACVAAAAVTALAAHDDASVADELLQRLSPRQPRAVRTAAAVGLARVAAAQRNDAGLLRRVRLRLEGLLGDATFAVRLAAVDALRDLGEASARTALERAHAAEPFALVRRMIREALGALATP
jgi:aminopeptidase N